MTVYSLIPFAKKGRCFGARGDGSSLARRTGLWGDLFEDFWGGGFGELAKSQGFVPDCNVTEDEGQYLVSVELAGIDEKDIEISLSEGVLTIKGEKKAENDRSEEGFRHIERSYGSFSRSINLAEEIDQDKVTAEFDKGVLKIQLPKIEPKKQKTRKIAITNN